MIISDTPMGCGFFIFFTDDPENSGGNSKSVADTWGSKGKSASRQQKTVRRNKK